MDGVLDREISHICCHIVCSHGWTSLFVISELGEVVHLIWIIWHFVVTQAWLRVWKSYLCYWKLASVFWKVYHWLCSCLPVAISICGHPFCVEVKRDVSNGTILSVPIFYAYCRIYVIWTLVAGHVGPRTVKLVRIRSFQRSDCVQECFSAAFAADFISTEVWLHDGWYTSQSVAEITGVRLVLSFETEYAREVVHVTIDAVAWSHLSWP